ncbi:type II secretion system protein GspD [Vogesella indigofera]|uniref:type II secretion system protein GspD n=1 Tax=Vogesella indigofera TaxID=45465 RepID=UPI00234F8847|nr:hypothetical protein [Vogesella indigofera]MDC7712197.1 hypothetical protein [Vogesella indigofera]
MIRLLAALMLCLALPATAESLALNFDKVPLMQFSEATFKAILKEDYIIDPSLIDDARRITVNVANIDRPAVRPLLDRLLLDSGIKVERRSGINWLLPTTQQLKQADGTPLPPGTAASPSVLPPADAEPFHLYQPLHRPVPQLQRLVNAFLRTSYEDPDYVIVSATDKRLKTALALIAQYDTKPLEVIARAAVIEYSEERDEGFSFKTAFSAFAGKLSVSLAGGGVLDNFVTFKNSSIEAVLSALEGDSRFSLVTQPTLRIKNGALGKFTVGSDVPVLDSIQVDKQGNPIQSVTYRQSGVIFSLKPTIMRDRIEVEVMQQLSNFQKTQTSNIDSPTLLKRELSTSVGVESGDIVVLAGLEESKDSNSSTGFSFLPDFMRTTKASNAKTQLLLVVEVKKL